MRTGFIRVTPGFLIDGRTLVVTGVKDHDGRIVATRARVATPERAAEIAFETYREAHGDVEVREVAISPALLAARPASFRYPIVAQN